ncbi:uncharacterized protein LOC141622462 isoform X1 [Silene latifolia]|uniref:uncharacterized protein LOC141622462 isoform X1 n=1 Tax=Silene latifolia TaxID=37657 RepID=UPI003D788F4E
MISPGFKSVAAMAGWDEEALLLASLIVEDTPERDAKNKKRSDLQFKSPPSSSRRKRRARRRSPVSMSIAVLNLDEDESTDTTDKGNEKREECSRNELPQKIERGLEKAEDGKEKKAEFSKSDLQEKVITDQGKAGEGSSAAASSSSTTLPCVDRLREELSCAICLDICFEPSTTPCGHSFCKKCLKNAADKCGKRCPKCRQLISNGRSCTINTVLWNTIQLLFPVEVEARKATEMLNSRETERQNPEATKQPESSSRATRRLRALGSTNFSRREDGPRNRGGGVVATQDEDAALALRLQREEFMDIYRGSSLARDNLRAMAQRAVNLRVRHRAV